jgi:hypothetical protein
MWRNQAQQEAEHPRLPEAVAWLYAGLDMALAFAEEKGALDHNQAEDYRQTGRKIFMELAANQGGRVEEERPGKRFIEGLNALMDQGKAVFWPKDEETPRKATVNETAVGWRDEDGFYLLNPGAAYAAVHDFCQRSGEPFTFKQNAVWKDLRRLGVIVCQNGRTGNSARIYGQPKRIIKLKEDALQGGFKW